MEQKDRTAAQRLDALVEKDLLTLEELDLSLEETERFYDRIERLNIDIAFEDTLLPVDEDAPPEPEALEEVGAVTEEEMNEAKAMADTLSTDDPVRMYLTEIGKVPPLSPEEEQDLLKRVAEGDEEAKCRMAEANLLLVVSIAKRHAECGMLFPDLIQEGNRGLIKAVETFDYMKGYKFSTYATWWICQTITRAIADCEICRRIPVHKVGMINKVIRVWRQLRHALGRDRQGARPARARAGAGRLGNGCVRAGAPTVKPPAPPPRNGRENNYEQSINNIGKALDFPGGGV